MKVYIVANYETSESDGNSSWKVYSIGKMVYGRLYNVPPTFKRYEDALTFAIKGKIPKGNIYETELV